MRIPIENVGWDAKILITRKCNLNCPFCKIKRSRKLKNELSFKEWKKGIKNLKKIGVKTIQILGGEPTTQSYLEDLIMFLNKENFFYSIESNSTFSEERFNSLIKAGIKGYCADVNTFNFQTKKDWYTIKSSAGFRMLLKMKKAGVPYLEVSVIINKRNIKEIPIIVKKMSQVGIWTNIIPVHYGKEFKWELRAKDVPDEFKIKESDRPTVEKTMNELVKMKRRGYLILNSENYFKDLAKINCSPTGWHCEDFPRLRIDSDGSLWICNDVKGDVALKYNILTLNKKTFENFKRDWQTDKWRLRCPGCAWPISKRIF
jgi:MoaA/NifB/PqqE/SkfB family radical SAM enzyme